MIRRFWYWLCHIFSRKRPDVLPAKPLIAPDELVWWLPASATKRTDLPRDYPAVVQMTPPPVLDLRPWRKQTRAQYEAHRATMRGRS